MSEFRNRRPWRPGKWRFSCLAFGFRLALLLYGMGGAQEALASGVEEESGLNLVASTSFIGELCETLAGDNAHIRVLMPRGTNPHSYQPSPGDLVAIENADLVFINGLGLEYQLRDALEFLDDVKLTDISRDIDILTAGHDEHGELHDEHGGLNPHLWFSPHNMMAAIRTIRTTLAGFNPEKSEIYIAREEEYVHRLEELDAWIRAETMNLEDRRLLTSHSFLDYYARDYGFEIVGNIFDSVNDWAEPSAFEISTLVNLLKEEGARAVFIDDSGGRAVKSLAETLVTESGRDIRIVELLTGSLASVGERGSDYFDFTIYNTELIVEALSGASGF